LLQFICLSFGQEAKNNNFGIDTLMQTEQYTCREYGSNIQTKQYSNRPFEYLNDDENAEIRIQTNSSASIHKTEKFEMKSPRRFSQSPETMKALLRDALPRSMKNLFMTMKRDVLQPNRSEEVHHSLSGEKTWIGEICAGQQLSSDREINCKRKWSENCLKPKKRNCHDPISYTSIENSRLEQMLQPKQAPLPLETPKQVQYRFSIYPLPLPIPHFVMPSRYLRWRKK
jgi:hypothetical protein